MVGLVISCALIALAQQEKTETENRVSTKWTEFYREAAKKYQVTRVDGNGTPKFQDRAIFNWLSIDDFHGALFAWTENGRPAIVATIFSFPVRGSKQRTAVHEFASFAESGVSVERPGGPSWQPSPLKKMERVPNAPVPPSNTNALKLQCRRLAKDFSADMNRRGERWDLRLLPTPLIEYQQSSAEILGGGLFAFVGYSTDPEILLLLEARKTDEGPVWCYQAVRFSDKSLFLKFKEKSVWESVRAGHGSDGPDTEDPLYRVLTSERIDADVVK